MFKTLKQFLTAPLLVVVLAGALSFCSRSTPTDGLDPSTWENLPEFEVTDTSSYFLFKMVTDTAPNGEEVKSFYQDWNGKSSLTVKGTGNFVKLATAATGESYGEAVARFYINKDKRIPSEAAVAYHVYINGSYVDTGEDPHIKDNIAAPNSTSNQLSFERVMAMTSKDTLQLICDFTATDGTHYKWTSPKISFE